MKVIRFILSVFFCFAIGGLLAQSNQALQTLKESLNTITVPSEKANVYNKLAELSIADSVQFIQYIKLAQAAIKDAPVDSIAAKSNALLSQYYSGLNQFQLAYVHANTALSLSLKSGSKLQLGIHTMLLGRVMNQWGKKDSSLILFEKAEQVFRKIKAQNELAACLNNIGFTLSELGRKEDAMQYFMDGLKISESLNDQPSLASSYNNFGKFLMESRNLKDAKLYLEKSIVLCRQINDQMTLGKALVNLGNVYVTDLKYDKGIELWIEADSVFEKIQFKRGIQAVNNNLGAVYLRKHDFAGAIPYLKKALEIAAALKTNSGVALIQQNIGFAYTYLKNYPEAKSWFLQAEATALLYSDKYTLGEIYKHRSSYDSAVGDFKHAYFYQLKYDDIKDSLLNEKISRQISELQLKFETEKKERLIQQQQFSISKRNYWIAGIAGLLILSTLLGFSYHRRNQLRQEKRLQFEIIKQQDFATKAIIEAEENERKRIAGDLHDGIGQMMSAAKMNLSGFQSRMKFVDDHEAQAFDRIIALVDESCKEVRAVSHNMMPNALLKSGLSSAVKEFIDKIDSKMLKVNLYTEGLNERLDANVETVLYRVIQECVNNVIKHAKANTLDIALIKDNEGIAATIEDNGVGFALSATDAQSGLA
ncbi:MAG: tetratricopeptide repeat protein [Ferruginibacter sp.]